MSERRHYITTGRRKIPFYIGVMVCLLVISGLCSFSAGPFAGTDSEEVNDKIKSLQKVYEESKRELEESKKRLELKEKEKKEILNKLERSDRDIEKLHSTLNSIKSKERSISKEIDASQQYYLEAEQNLNKYAGHYAQRMRSMYKRQRVSAMEMLFSAGSISAMLRGLRTFTVLAKDDIEVMDTVRDKKQTMETSVRKLRTARDAQRSLSKKKRSEEMSLERTRKDRQALLAEIKRDEELEKEMIIQHQNDMEKTQAMIEKLLRDISKETQKRDFLEEISDDIKNYDFAGRKGKLPWPVTGSVVSSFGVVTDPKTKTKTNNRGIEIETKNGEPVCAVGSGIVMATQSFRWYGNFVMIYHPPRFVTIYAHLSDILVNVNSEVREGDIIGLAGSTGLIDDVKSQLLLEVLNGKTPENPLTWLRKEQRTASR